MKNKTLVALTAVGLAAAISIPTVVFGNARRDSTGDLEFLKTEQTPFVANLLGVNENVGANVGDTDGFGSAAVTFDLADPTASSVCWDLSYGNLEGTPVAAHIHKGLPGVAGPVVIPFGIGTGPTDFSNLGASGAHLCRLLTSTEVPIAQDVVAHPADYYANVHTSPTFPLGAIRGQLSAGPPPAGEAHLLAEPVRAFDSRDSSGAKLALNTTKTVSLATGKNAAGATVVAVPAGATAAIVTLTATDTEGTPTTGGFLKIYDADLPGAPATSSINWTGAGQNIAVTTQVAVNAAGQVKVTDGANATHFVIDVIGYLF